LSYEDLFASAPADAPAEEAQQAPPAQEPVGTATVAKPVVVTDGDGKVVLTFKGGRDFDAPWIVIHATSNRLEPSANEDIGEVADELDPIPIRFNYKASPSLDVIEESLAAYDALYEDYPALIVVDNITNVRTDSSDGDDPFSGLESLMDYLHEMARETGSCVTGLHHVTGQHNNGDSPIPLGGIKGQIGRVPEMILTLHRVSDGFSSDSLNVSTVKNRGGKSDPSGQDFASLEFVGETMQIRDLGS
jgi:hypothetical protein